MFFFFLTWNMLYRTEYSGNLFRQFDVLLSLTSSNLVWVSLLLCSSPLALMTTTKPQDLYLVKPSRDSLCLAKKVLMVGCVIFVLLQFQYYGMNWRKIIFRQAYVKERCNNYGFTKGALVSFVNVLQFPFTLHWYNICLWLFKR